MDISKVLSREFLIKRAEKVAGNVLNSSVAQKTFSAAQISKPDAFVKAAKAATETVSEEIPAVIDEKYLHKLSEKMYKDAKIDFAEYMGVLKKAFGDTGIPLTGRVKDPSSTYPKLLKRAHYIKEGYRPMSLVPDVYGFKLTTDGSAGEIEKVVKRIEKLVDDDGILMPSHILNHGAVPYFSDSQIERLNQKGFLVSSNAKKTGFSGVNMYFKDLFTDKTIELQIRGKKVNKMAEKEHLWYNFKTKGSASKHGEVVEKFQKLFEGMSEAQTELYEKYVDECYRYSRNLELGNKLPKPSLPEGLNKMLALV